MISINFIKHNNTRLVILGLLLFIVGFSIPFSYAFNSIAIGALFVYSFIWFEKSNYTALLKNGFQVHALFLIYFLIQFFGVFYSDDLNLGFNYLIQNIVFLLVPITFINLSKVLNYNTVKLGIYGFALAVLVILTSIYTNIFVKMVSQQLDLKDLIVHFVRENFVQEGLVHIHPPYFGLMVVFALVVVLKTTFHKNTVLNGILKYFISAYLIAALYGISSFMSIILVVLLFLVYIFFLIKSKKWKVLVSIILPISLLLIIAGSFINTSLVKKFPGESLLGRIEWSFIKGKGDTSRPENWRSVLVVITDNPFIGVGTYGGLNYLQEQRSKTSESYINEHNAHNQYLETLLRHGIIGLLVFLLMIYCLVVKALKSRDIIFCSFVLVFSVASITESYLMRQIGLTFFVFFALLYGTYYNFGDPKKALE